MAEETREGQIKIITVKSYKFCDNCVQYPEMAQWSELELGGSFYHRKQGRDIDLSHSSDSQTVKKFDASISFPPVNLEIIKKQLNTR
ncbi:GC-rich sequence DNA-binding factor 2 [Camelus dromedarius]|uniref:GC-rich sequence DNA-binding factor 2 n=1 Tax=Camelus dromedarius TaxID=9838 RepID=A0A5N4CD60_CAMDR|nr:GC-rich sequence DNA-binding factor 2 [Camelus dromedarius]KAB1256841.1 GC-rich sequence DNA-binding factor 2 [Camelus dromedarius]